jgi:hypothetical protein
MDRTTEETPSHRIVSFVDRDLAERLVETARRNERSLSAEVRLILRHWAKEGVRR